MGQEYRRTTATVSLINYHFVFCPRYRRKVLVKHVEARFKELVQELCVANDWLIVTLEVMPDHVHLFLNVLPTDSPADVMAKLKGATSRDLRKEFPHLTHLPSLWTRSYFVSTAGNVSSETIKRYVEEQKKRG
ncbi:IS200/IS605 family transposase [Paenibacillus sp. MER TA 81-3]|uniref:IS200/IS605 family transposase n=1 Tax=Paenibacillus sp. MER TA 81-3 TaxID=2939573 RepID=UPI00203FF122|nr:IS200/IS605 family transposase [Paenibacillus sp. MER TA 81-3]MCM3342618.1 IS200/IS605 family transposase [Paenibacillus sp. MER TA 81-3]